MRRYRGPGSSADHVRRDGYRKPLETLEFFGLKKDSDIRSKVGPAEAGRRRILAPYLAEDGLLIGATYNQDDGNDKGAITQPSMPSWPRTGQRCWGSRTMRVLCRGSGRSTYILDFRNAHNWLRQGPLLFQEQRRRMCFFREDRR